MNTVNFETIRSNPQYYLKEPVEHIQGMKYQAWAKVEKIELRERIILIIKSIALIVFTCGIALFYPRSLKVCIKALTGKKISISYVDWKKLPPEEIKKAVKINGLLLEYAPKEIQDMPEVVLEAVTQNGAAIEFASDKLKADPAIANAARKQCPASIIFAKNVTAKTPVSMTVSLEDLKHDGLLLKIATEDQKNDKAFVSVAIKENGLAFEYVSKALKEDKDLAFEAACYSNKEALKFAESTLKAQLEKDFKSYEDTIRGLYNQYVNLPEPIRNSRAFAYYTIEANFNKVIDKSDEFDTSFEFQDTPWIYWPPELQKDKDLMLAVVLNRPVLLGMLPPEYQNDLEVVLKVVRKVGLGFAMLDEKFIDSSDIVMAAVIQDGDAFEYASDRLKEDKLFVKEAVKLSPKVFHNASINLRNNKEFVLQIVTINGLALEGASKELIDDDEVVLAAIKQTTAAFQYASKRLQHDRKMVLESVKIDGRLGYIPYKFLSDPEVVAEAAKKNPEARKFVSKESNTDESNTGPNLKNVTVRRKSLYT